MADARRVRGRMEMSPLDELRARIEDALATLGAGSDGGAPLRLERPSNADHGDWSTNVALVRARSLGLAPRALAERLVAALEEEPLPDLAAVEVAGAGFVNFRTAPSWLHRVLVDAVSSGEAGYGRVDIGHGERVQLEFVSANPTGPLHVGNGWWSAYGDSLARVLARCGFQVQREYYVNDTGGQIRRLGESLLALRRGEAVPEGGYQGAYVGELAKLYDGPGDVSTAGRWAAERILGDIRRSLERVGIHFDEWFSQASIEESGAVEETVELLRSRSLVYESEGALWLASSDLGDTRDRVLRKSPENGGDWTYLAGDLAYHRNKFLVRGFDRVIDIFGADHHGQVASLKAGVAALGVDPGRLEVKLGQMVSLAEGRMSKRAGNFVRLEELVDDIGPDAFRLLSLVSSIDQPTVLDLALVREQTMENPVYYVQYAHARIASIARTARERGFERRPLGEVSLDGLVHPRELELLRSIEDLPGVVALAAQERAPHKVTAWVRELAGRFHGFYHDCRVLDEEGGEELVQARLWLVEAARVGLAIGLDLLGVSAPETM